MLVVRLYVRENVLASFSFVLAGRLKGRRILGRTGLTHSRCTGLWVLSGLSFKCA